MRWFCGWPDRRSTGLFPPRSDGPLIRAETEARLAQIAHHDADAIRERLPPRSDGPRRCAGRGRRSGPGRDRSAPRTDRPPRRGCVETPRTPRPRSPPPPWRRAGATDAVLAVVGPHQAVHHQVSLQAQQVGAARTGPRSRSPRSAAPPGRPPPAPRAPDCRRRWRGARTPAGCPDRARADTPAAAHRSAALLSCRLRSLRAARGGSNGLR